MVSSAWYLSRREERAGENTEEETRHGWRVAHDTYLKYDLMVNHPRVRPLFAFGTSRREKEGREAVAGSPAQQGRYVVMAWNQLDILLLYFYFIFLLSYSGHSGVSARVA